MDVWVRAGRRSSSRFFSFFPDPPASLCVDACASLSCATGRSVFFVRPPALACVYRRDFGSVPFRLDSLLLPFVAPRKFLENSWKVGGIVPAIVFRYVFDISDEIVGSLCFPAFLDWFGGEKRTVHVRGLSWLEKRVRAWERKRERVVSGLESRLLKICWMVRGLPSRRQGSQRVATVQNFDFWFDGCISILEKRREARRWKGDG